MEKLIPLLKERVQHRHVDMVEVVSCFGVKFFQSKALLSAH